MEILVLNYIKSLLHTALAVQKGHLNKITMKKTIASKHSICALK